MSNRRPLAWNAVLRDLRSDRAAIPAGFISARDRIAGLVRIRRRPLVVAGKYDRSAIMAAAVEAARAHQERHGGTWGEAMSVCLKASWQAARIVRNAAAH